MIRGNLKTTIGGVIAIATVGLLLFNKINTQNAIVLLGVAAGWVGVAGADSKKPDA